MTIRLYSENRFVDRIKNKVDTRDFYRLNLLISKNNYIKNFYSCNFANIFVNFFRNLSSTLINFRSSPSFLVFSCYFAISNNINDYKPLNSTFLDGSAICNFDTILTFYY